MLSSPTVFTYQWLRGTTPIPGATSSTYVCTSADSGSSLTCTVTTGLTPSTSSSVSIVATMAYPAIMAGLAPALWLRLIDQSGLQAVDSSGNNHNGLYSATGVTFSPAKVILGPGGTVTVPNDPSFTNLSCTPGSSWTVTMWLELLAANFPPAVPYPVLLMLGDGGNGTGWQVFGSTNLCVKAGKGLQSGTNVPTPLTTLSAVSVTWDGTTVHFHQNGKLVGSDPTMAGAVVTDTSSSLRIGPNVVASEVAVFKIALSDAQHAELFAAHTPKAPIIAPPVVVVPPPIVVVPSVPPPDSNTSFPSGPHGPATPNGVRLLFADDFNGLDTNMWNLDTSGPNNPWEHATYNASQVSVANSVCSLTCVPGNQNGFNYVSGHIMTGGSPNNFLVSPQNAGPIWIEAKIKIPGDAPGSNGSVFPAFWFTTYRTWGLSSDDWRWTREMDFFEFGLQPRAGQRDQMDSTQLGPSGGYGSGSMVNYQNPNQQLSFDPAADFHVYTAQVNANGSFSLWIDGNHIWDLNPYAAIDYMGIVINYALGLQPAGNFTSDSMQIAYVACWQDASVPQGRGIIGGGIAKGTVVP